jgi:hypothetical protein
VKIRERIREQSRQVAEYMAGQAEKPKRYQVLWDCPKCGNSHNWWWEDKFEAWDDGECDMVCDRCMEPTRCKGDGTGFYAPVEETAPDTDERIKDLYDGLNALAKRVADIETGEIFDNLSRRVTTAELAIANLEDGVKAETYRDRAKKPPSVIDLIHGERPPFHERFREGCGFNEETMPGETLAAILRFVAVEVERMTERDMGGSFTISNLKVGENLRALADEAEAAQ